MTINLTRQQAIRIAPQLGETWSTLPAEMEDAGVIVADHKAMYLALLAAAGGLQWGEAAAAAALRNDLNGAVLAALGDYTHREAAFVYWQTALEVFGLRPIAEPVSRAVEMHDRGGDVAFVQNVLVQPVTGVYDQELADAVEGFQVAVGLPVTGKVDPETRLRLQRLADPP